MLWSLFIPLIALGTLPSCTTKPDPECKALINSQKPGLNWNTCQSSVYTESDNVFTSVKALDGNMSTCAHTSEQTDNWWTVDLLGVHTIFNITIYNTDGTHANIKGAQIFIGNSRKDNGTTNKMCANITDFTKDHCNDFKCTLPISGRYITVFRAVRSFVILCEMRINGTKKESPFELVKEEKTWEEALDYCRDRNMDLASILDEETQAFAELEARNATTPFVWLGLRYTCTLSFWFWVADHHLIFSNWAPGRKTEDCNMSAAMNKTEDHQWYSMSDQNKYNFICEKYVM